jgi:ethanolamine ammonia-lyase large subunit
MDGQELRRIFSLANAFKEGDLMVDGTTDDRVREDARRVLLATTVGDIRRAVLVDDGVTAALERSRDRRFDNDLDALTIARVKALLLGPGAAAWAQTHQDALASEAVAAVAKVMTNDELSLVARVLFNPLDADGSPSAVLDILARAYSRTARVTTNRRFCFRFWKGCRTAAATCSSA